jgi:hypothetical protein
MHVDSLLNLLFLRRCVTNARLYCDACVRSIFATDTLTFINWDQDWSLPLPWRRHPHRDTGVIVFYQKSTASEYPLIFTNLMIAAPLHHSSYCVTLQPFLSVFVHTDSSRHNVRGTDSVDKLDIPRPKSFFLQSKREVYSVNLQLRSAWGSSFISTASHFLTLTTTQAEANVFTSSLRQGSETAIIILITCTSHCFVALHLAVSMY